MSHGGQLDRVEKIVVAVVIAVILLSEFCDQEFSSIKMKNKIGSTNQIKSYNKNYWMISE